MYTDCNMTFGSSQEDNTVYICDNFMKEMERYLKSKCPELSEATIMEIASYTANRMVVTLNDLNYEHIRRVNEDWRSAERKLRAANDKLYEELRKEKLRHEACKL